MTSWPTFYKLDLEPPVHKMALHYKQIKANAIINWGYFHNKIDFEILVSTLWNTKYGCMC